MKWFTLACIILFSMSGCGGETKYKKINTKSTARAAVSPVKTTGNIIKDDIKTIRIAIAPIVSLKESRIYYDELINYLYNTTGVKTEIIQKKTYIETINLLGDNLCDVAFLCSGPYIRAKKDFSVEVLVEPVASGKNKYFAYIIVSSDSKADDFSQLRGSSFAFCDPLSLTGFLMPKYMLNKMNEKPEEFFKQTIFTNSHDLSIKAVAEKFVDGAAVDSLVYDYLKREKDEKTLKTKIIGISQPLGIPPVVVRKGLDPKIVRKIRDAFLSMDKDPEGRKILEHINVDCYVEPGKDDYKDAERIMLEMGSI